MPYNAPALPPGAALGCKSRYKGRVKNEGAHFVKLRAGSSMPPGCCCVTPLSNRFALGILLWYSFVRIVKE
jgi:hypothetical protein